MAKMSKGVKTGKPMATPSKKAPKGLKRPAGGNFPLVKGGKGGKKGGMSKGGDCY